MADRAIAAIRASEAKPDAAFGAFAPAAALIRSVAFHDCAVLEGGLKGQGLARFAATFLSSTSRLTSDEGSDMMLERADHPHRGQQRRAYNRRQQTAFLTCERSWFRTGMAHPTGLEPVTSSFGGWRSIHLSYGCPCASLNPPPGAGSTRA